MVLEALLSPFKAERNLWETFFLGFLYNTVAVFISLWIFSKYSSLVMVFLTVIACAPLIYSTMRIEERKDLEIEAEGKLLKEHSKALLFMMVLFVGITVSCAIWYVVLPAKTITSLYSIQTETITTINSSITGLSIDYLGVLTRIFMNNVKVMIFCILFAFVYGLGAMFIIIWNASVIGVAMGNYFRTHFSTYVAAAGYVKFAGYFHIGSMSLLRYAIHGIPEILAYFIGGLAGGIISIAITRHDFGTKNFEKVLLDCSDLIIISLGVLFVAALLEVFVTPLFF